MSSLADRLAAASRDRAASQSTSTDVEATGGRRKSKVTERDPFADLKVTVHNRLLTQLGPKLYDANLTQGELERMVRGALQEAMQEEDVVLTPADRTRIAQEIRALIRAETGLTASAGVSYNKFLAKLASDQRKPDGLFVIPPEAGPAFVLTLPIGRFHGIGPATSARMERHGIRTGADLHRQSLEFLSATFGKSGSYYYNIARGIDHREVRPDRERKSVGAENTFFTDIHDLSAAAEALAPLADKVWRHAEPNGISGRTVTLKAKYADFRIVTRARSLARPVMSRDELLALATGMLPQVLPDPRPHGVPHGAPQGVRLLGITLSALCPPEPPEVDGQLPLFG